MKKGFALLLLFVAVPCLFAQKKKHQEKSEQAAEQRPATDARSFMELFTKLERDWADAIQRKDRAALDAILAPEFLVRTAADPEHPIERAEWVNDTLSKYQLRSYTNRAMVIRAFLGVAVVSFIQSQQVSVAGKDRHSEYLIVDLWETDSNKIWHPAARYIAAVENHTGPTAELRR